jgi:hypothetical protein
VSREIRGRIEGDLWVVVGGGRREVARGGPRNKRLSSERKPVASVRWLAVGKSTSGLDEREKGAVGGEGHVTR